MIISSHSISTLITSPMARLPSLPQLDSSTRLSAGDNLCHAHLLPKHVPVARVFNYQRRYVQSFSKACHLFSALFTVSSALMTPSKPQQPQPPGLPEPPSQGQPSSSVLTHSAFSVSEKRTTPSGLTWILCLSFHQVSSSDSSHHHSPLSPHTTPFSPPGKCRSQAVFHIHLMLSYSSMLT